MSWYEHVSKAGEIGLFCQISELKTKHENREACVLAFWGNRINEWRKNDNNHLSIYIGKIPLHKWVRKIYKNHQERYIEWGGGEKKTRWVVPLGDNFHNIKIKSYPHEFL